MAIASRFKRSIEINLSDYGPADAIFMVENEAAKLNKNDEGVIEIYRIADSIISDEDIYRALETSLDQLNQFNQIILHGSTMGLEEWVLVITIISSCYCTNMFSLRRGIAVQEEKLANAVQLLREFTSEFCNRDFQRALTSARRYNANPLSAPLQ